MWHHIVDFLNFWWTCVGVGWHFGDGIFAFIVEISLMASACLFLFKKHHHKKWKKLEETLMKIAFSLFVGSFIVATFFVAPFLQYKDVEDKLGNSNPPKHVASPPSPQWYLKLDFVESVPPITNPKIIRPFRIEAEISGQSYSFPTRLMYYAGLTNILEGAILFLCETNLKDMMSDLQCGTCVGSCSL